MDSFIQRKNSVLKKIDKSNKSSWDERIISICNKLNKNENYYTTSSCSGKSVILEEKIGKDGTYYLWTSHDLIKFEELKKIVFSLEKKEIKYKSESPIIYVVCRDIESAKTLFEKSIQAGFKESGIKLTNKLIAVEIRSGEKIEFPLISKKNILITEEFLKEVVKITNKKRKIGWQKIKKLFSLID